MGCEGNTQLCLFGVAFVVMMLVWVWIGGPESDKANDRRIAELSPTERYYDAQMMGGCTGELMVAAIVGTVVVMILNWIFGCW